MKKDMSECSEMLKEISCSLLMLFDLLWFCFFGIRSHACRKCFLILDYILTLLYNSLLGDKKNRMGQPKEQQQLAIAQNIQQ